MSNLQVYKFISTRHKMNVQDVTICDLGGEHHGMNCARRDNM